VAPTAVSTPDLSQRPSGLLEHALATSFAGEHPPTLREWLTFSTRLRAMSHISDPKRIFFYLHIFLYFILGFTMQVQSQDPPAHKCTATDSASGTAIICETPRAGIARWLGHRSDPPCAQHPNMRGIAFRRMAGTPRAFFYSVAASRCAFGGWWGYCAAAPTGRETP
jgi:hypothetical protein